MMVVQYIGKWLTQPKTQIMLSVFIISFFFLLGLGPGAQALLSSLLITREVVLLTG